MLIRIIVILTITIITASLNNRLQNQLKKLLQPMYLELSSGLMLKTVMAL